MRGTSFVVGVGAIVALVGCVAASAQPGARSARAASDVGYAIGRDIGQFTVERLREDAVSFDVEALVAGFTDAVHGAESRLDDSEMRRILQEIEGEVRGRLAGERLERDPVFRALAEENLRRSREFHGKFGEAEGVVTLPSGVQFLTLTQGRGATPGPSDTALISFEGELLSGVEFAEGNRVEIQIADLMEGGREALTRMPVGSKWRVAIPPERAFGLAGRDPDVGPNETLIFTVELYEIVR